MIGSDSSDRRVRRRPTLRELVAVAVLSLLVAVCYWPIWSLVPQHGLDPSWELGLAWATKLGYHWGDEIIFTFGPLGFTHEPMAFSAKQVVLASAIHVLATAMAVTAAYYLARERFAAGHLAALGVSGLATAVGLFAAPAVFVAVVFGSMATLVSRSWVAIVAVGLALGVAGHQKLSTAVIGLVIASGGSFGARGWRGLLALALSTALSWLGVWLVSGQPLDQLPSWIRGAIEITMGYSPAMNLERIGVEWHYLVVALLVPSLLALAWLVGRQQGGRRAIALFVAYAIAIWLLWRAGFVRHDPGHARLFMLQFMVLTSALVLVSGRRWLLAGATVAFVAYVAYVAMGGVFLSPVDRTQSLHAAGRTVEVVTSQASRVVMLREARAKLANDYAITAEITELIGDGPVSVDPWDVSAAWAAGVEWRPVPIFQMYSSYTSELDERNRTSLESNPRYLMRSVPYKVLPHRHPSWESPTYQTAVYCGYDVLAETWRWQVLGPAARDRCGEPTGAMTVEAGADEPVEVPRRDGMMTLLTLEPNPSWVERLIELAFKGPDLMIDYGDRQWRYVHASEATRLMLNTPVLHPSFDALPLTPHRTVSFERPATYTFEFVPVVPAFGTSSEPGTASHSDLVIHAASQADALDTAPGLIDAEDADVTWPDSGCLVVSPTDVEPSVTLSVPSGFGLHLSSVEGGRVRVSVQAESTDSAGADSADPTELTRSLPVNDAPVVISTPTRADGSDWQVRVEPDGSGATVICQANASS